MTIPTREEWKALVAKHGYHQACRMIDCDLDDVPGIEDTWVENFESMADDFAKSEREFFEEMKRRGRSAGESAP